MALSKALLPLEKEQECSSVLIAAFYTPIALRVPGLPGASRQLTTKGSAVTADVSVGVLTINQC